ncbi:hypothetical protein CAFE_00790 [Caprobacter fermentans]|uniref:Uncharacterized protein n=1 Tax=Caproicibacter fermentans TaxID=2576756 RepID=A0A6N8HVI4_9FIRM|nr:hypothetical protein [Caproicibacter fermentans]MVB09423.1 hypothetical protein [Caproicibacter fermentans]
MKKLFIRVVGLALLFFNMMYCADTVQSIWVTEYEWVAFLGTGRSLVDYIHPFTFFAVIVNFGIAIYLLYLSRGKQNGKADHDCSEKQQISEDRDKEKIQK